MDRPIAPLNYTLVDAHDGTNGVETSHAHSGQMRYISLLQRIEQSHIQ